MEDMGLTESNVAENGKSGFESLKMEAEGKFRIKWMTLV